MTSEKDADALLVRVEDAGVAGFANAIGWTSSQVPTTWPMTVLPRTPSVAELVRQCSHGGLVPIHAVQSFRYRRPLRISETLTCQTSLTGSTNERCSLKLHMTDTSGEPVCDANSTLLLARTLPPTAVVRDPASAPGSANPPASLESSLLTAEMFRTYQQASGDTNPVHHDHAAAQSLGLERPIAPGMMILGMLTSLLARTLEQPDIARLDAMFIAPVPAETILSLSINTTPTPGRYSLVATDRARRVYVKATAVAA
jgi:acyl dehydratase